LIVHDNIILCIIHQAGFAGLYGALTSCVSMSGEKLTFILRIFSALLSIGVGVAWVVLTAEGLLHKYIITSDNIVVKAAIEKTSG